MMLFCYWIMPLAPLFLSPSSPCLPEGMGKEGRGNKKRPSPSSCLVPSHTGCPRAAVKVDHCLFRPVRQREKKKRGSSLP